MEMSEVVQWRDAFKRRRIKHFFLKIIKSNETVLKKKKKKKWKLDRTWCPALQSKPELKRKINRTELISFLIRNGVLQSQSFLLLLLLLQILNSSVTSLAAFSFANSVLL